MTAMKIGEVAKRSGTGIETIRFYERRGLLPVPPRRDSGYREYPPENVRLIRFIKRSQELGFSLGEIKELLALRVQKGTTCADVRERAEHKLEEVREKIADLKSIERALRQLTAMCTGHGPLSDCPILENLDGEL